MQKVHFEHPLCVLQMGLLSKDVRDTTLLETLPFLRTFSDGRKSRIKTCENAICRRFFYEIVMFSIQVLHSLTFGLQNQSGNEIEIVCAHHAA